MFLWEYSQFHCDLSLLCLFTRLRINCATFYIWKFIVQTFFKTKEAWNRKNLLNVDIITYQKKLCINEVITYQHKVLFKFHEKQKVLCSISCNKPVWILNWPKPTLQARKKLYFTFHLQCNKLFNVNLICWLPDVFISWVKENYFKI